ncbi:MAG: hypothetical protein JWR75_307 [Devosia sp.]|nr:hypothetical protein [Devosia sp.]
MKFARTLMLGVAALTIMGSAVQAADLILPPPAMLDPIYESPMFDFEGLYVGVQGGAFFPLKNGDAGSSFGSIDHTAGLIGLVAGANFLVTDMFLAGLEVQGNFLFGGNTTSSDEVSVAAISGAGYAAEGLILGKLGVVLTDNVLAYAAAGVGVMGGNAFGDNSGAFYAVGGGLEFGVTDNLGLRGEVLYRHLFNDQASGVSGHGLSATVGLIFHVN